MRKSYNGLFALVKNTLGENPLSGNLFVLINRRRTQMKIFYFDRARYGIWSKRLEQGQSVIHDVNPFTYLTDVLQRNQVHPNKNVEKLTPRL